MDKWLEEFRKKNGREPTFAEFQAHNAEQKPAATSPASVQQSAQAEKPAESGQSMQSEQVNPSMSANQGAQEVQPTQNISNAQPTYSALNAQATHNAADTPQPQSMNATVNRQTNHTEGLQQPQAAPQKANAGQQGFPQSNQSLATKKPNKSGSKVGRFFHSPLGVTATAVLILLIGFVATGLLTTTSRSSLRNKYNNAVKNKDTRALLALFPKKQTESRFADVGAQSLIEANISFDEIEGYTSTDDFNITESKHLLFFKSYSLNASTTMVKKGNTPSDGKLIIDDREVNDKDFKTAFFPGTYKIKLKVKNQFGKAEFNTKLKTGNRKTVSLNFDIKDKYVTLPAGPDSISVAYEGEETEIKLSDKKQKIGPFEKPSNVDMPLSYNVTLSGEYGGFKIRDASLYAMIEDPYGFRLDGKEMLPFDMSYVSYDVKKYEPTVKKLASEWFKAGQQGSTKGLDTLDDLIEGTKLPDIYEDTASSKFVYKSAEPRESRPYVVYIGHGKDVYVVVDFTLTYTVTSTQKGVKPRTFHDPFMFVFQLDKDGTMKAKANYFELQNPS